MEAAGMAGQMAPNQGFSGDMQNQGFAGDMQNQNQMQSQQPQTFQGDMQNAPGDMQMQPFQGDGQQQQDFNAGVQPIQLQYNAGAKGGNFGKGDYGSGGVPGGGKGGRTSGGAPVACPVILFGTTFVESSPWVCKKISCMNNSGLLQAPIDWDQVTSLLSVLPESTAITFLKELEETQATVPDPTTWLVHTASNYAEGFMKGQVKEGSLLSRKVGTLNRNGALQENVQWTDVAGPLLVMDEPEALSLVEELGVQAGAIRNPTAWLKSSAERAAKRKR